MNGLKIEKWENTQWANTNQKKVGAALLISDKSL